MDFSRVGLYAIILGVVVVMLLFAFDLLNGNKLENPVEMTKGLQGTETTTKWVDAPQAKETSVVKSKTSFSEVTQNKIVAAGIDKKQNLHVLFSNGTQATLSPMQRLMIQNPLANYYMAESLGWGK